MGLFRLASIVLFAAAAVCAFGWLFNATLTTDVGLVAAGLFFQAAAAFDPSPEVLLK